VSKHRAEVKPRWGRIFLSAVAGLVVLVALVAGIGVMHGSGGAHTAYDPAAHVAQGQPSVAGSPAPTTPHTSSTPTYGADSASSEDPTAGASQGALGRPLASAATALPPDSGHGRRAVYSISRQRVWIVDAGGRVERTYLVSGSVEDNLDTGTYAVYSRSRWAVGIDDSGVMQYFVRFARGNDQGAPIGFHSIPTKDGHPLQTVGQLGTPQSHGCIRQKTADAIAMWHFARIGTKVVVVA